jgi:CubicO group peptidase (beta-lactamase class C family)
MPSVMGSLARAARRAASRVFPAASGLVLAVSCGETRTTRELDAAFVSAHQIPNLTSLVVVQGGRTLRQLYLGGTGPDTPHDVRSVTKSVTALLVGMALDEGGFASLDEPIGPLLGAAAPADPAKAAITLRQLLTMSSGLQWNELGNVAEYNAWVSAPDQVAYVLARPLVDPPGQVFDYDSAAFHLLSVMVTRTLGPTPAFAESGLFAALGIGARDWETDAQGYANGASGLQLTPRDMQAIGGLVLDRGRTGTQQVVSAAFLDAATAQQIATGDTFDGLPGYGYGWWIGTGGEAVAEGYGGQFIVVAPRLGVVVTATADWQGIGSAAATQFQQIRELIMLRILPAF